MESYLSDESPSTLHILFVAKESGTAVGPRAKVRLERFNRLACAARFFFNPRMLRTIERTHRRAKRETRCAKGRTRCAAQRRDKTLSSLKTKHKRYKNERRARESNASKLPPWSRGGRGKEMGRDLADVRSNCASKKI